MRHLIFGITFGLAGIAMVIGTVVTALTIPNVAVSVLVWFFGAVMSFYCLVASSARLAAFERRGD